MIKNVDIERFCQELSKTGIVKYGARNFTGRLALKYEGGAWLLWFENGEIVKVMRPSARVVSDMFIEYTDEEWEKVLAPNPEPFYNSIELTGKRDRSLLSNQYAQFLNEFMLALRRYVNGQPVGFAKPALKEPNVRTEGVVGRYIYLTIDGIEYRVYYEESGEGMPMLLQHTAGADGRQYRKLMNDEELCKKFRFIAPDLPYHGKSLPPDDYPWWEDEYDLTLDFILKFYDVFVDALKLDRPAYLGCSTGGQLAPDLAYYRPEKFRACVGIGGGLSSQAVDGSLDVQRGYLKYVKDGFWNPAVYNAATAGLMEQAVPVHVEHNARREVGWVYSQGGPGIYPGDNYYYLLDHNLFGKAQDIDTSKCMLYIMAGTYDPGNTPEVAKALTDQVKGSKLIVMEGLGHFSVIETYDEFREYFMQIVPEILTLK